MLFKSKVAEPNRVTEYVHSQGKESFIAEFVYDDNLQIGIFETSNPEVINELKTRGYEVVGEEESEESFGEEDDGLTIQTIKDAMENDDLDSIKIKDLLIYADKNKIDLGDAKKKADIVKIILESQ